MNTKTYQARTMEQALEEARRELGDDIVIMHSQRRRGILGSTYVVTVGVEDDIPLPDYKDAFEAAEAGRARLADQMPAQAVPASLNEVRSNSVFNAVADEPVSIPPLAPQEAADRSEDRDGADSLTSKVSAEELRSTFQAVEEVIAKSREPVEESPLSKTTYNRRASLVRYNDPAGSVEYTRDTPARKPRRQFVSPREESVSVGKDSFETEGTLERGEEIAEHKNKIIRAIYKVLMDHEVDERYINQMMDELDVSVLSEASIETALGMVYQKLVLKYGRPKLLTLEGKKPKVVFFIGPTGVGKTTTIAKLAGDFRLKQKKKVALFTADTYRIAAMSQLAEYGNLMNIEVEVLYIDDNDDINEKIAKSYARYDLILVDTSGFSHHDEEQRESLKALLDSLSDRYEKQVYLVLSATTKYRDLRKIIDVYKSFTDFDLLFTKLDETEVYGNILNIKLYADVSLSYVTTGQLVPDDFEVIDPQKMVHSLLGGG